MAPATYRLASSYFSGVVIDRPIRMNDCNRAKQREVNDDMTTDYARSISTLASLNIAETVAFYTGPLGFSVGYLEEHYTPRLAVGGAVVDHVHDPHGNLLKFGYSEW